MRASSRLATLVALGAAVTLALTGCTNKNEADTGAGGGGSGSGGAAAGKIKVAFVPKLQGIPYFEAMNAGGKEAAEATGQRRVALPGTDPGRRGCAGRHRPAYIQQKVNALIVAPNDPDSMAPLLQAGQRRRDQGRHRRTPTRRTRCARSFVNQASAEGIGQAATDALMEAMGGKGKYAIVSCGQTAEQLNQWIEESKHTRRRSIRTPRSSTSSTPVRIRPKATQMATDLMNAHPDLKGFVGECSSSAPGCGAGRAERRTRSGRSSPSGMGTPHR